MTKFDQKIGRIWIDRELEKNLDQIKSRPNLISDTIMILEDFSVENYEIRIFENWKLTKIRW